MIIRKIGIIGRTYHHAQRYRHILSVLFKYGFGDMVDILKVEQYLEIGLQMISRKRREKEPDIELLQRDMAEFMDQYLYLPLKSWKWERLKMEFEHQGIQPMLSSHEKWYLHMFKLNCRLTDIEGRPV